jgi:protocatechuate 3,4-dioxygenase beta subunit
MSPRYNLDSLFTRRELLGLLGAAGVTFVACGDDDNGGSATAAPTSGSTTTLPATAAGGTVTPQELACVLTPELTEGPFFVDERLDRSDITTDPSTGAAVEGVPLTLTLRAYSVQGGACTPLSGATIDVWHTDAEGRYSDVAQNNTAGQQFLRGLQTTDVKGEVVFQTIYPGWYPGRAVHIHFKLRQFDGSATTYEFTSQLFFDDALSDDVFASNALYSARGDRDTRNSNDGIYGEAGDQLLLSLTPDDAGYAGTFQFGVAM